MFTFAAVANFFLRTPLGRAIGIGMLAVALAGGVYLKGRGDGAQSERVRIAREELDPLRTQMESDRKQFSGELKTYHAAAQQKDEIIGKQAELIARLDARIADYDRQRAQQAQAIARMTDTEVFADLTRRLGVRDPKDATPQLYPGEIRKADTVIADAEIQAKKLADLDAKVDAQADKYSTLAEKQALTERQLALALDYIEKADSRFSDAYNIFTRTHRRPLWQKVLSFGILRDKKITELKPIVPPEKPKGMQ